MVIEQTLRRVYILGNGFDVDLGYKTRYSDFAGSDEWKEVMEKLNNTIGHALLCYLEEKRRTEKWFDIEAELMKYASVDHEWRVEKNPMEDEKDFNQLCHAFGEYAKKIEYWNYKEDSCAARLMQTFRRFDTNTLIYSFNYTPLAEIISGVTIDYYSGTNCFDLHGTLAKQNYILGFETNQKERIRKEYSFLFKSNSPHYKSSDIAKDMLKAHEVVIFGHSLNEIDFVYFKDYFSYLLQNDASEKNERILTIITYDDLSERMIKDNIRNMGYSLPQLFMHTQIEFIKAYNVENKLGDDAEKFDKLLKYEL